MKYLKRNWQLHMNLITVSIKWIEFFFHNLLDISIDSNYHQHTLYLKLCTKIWSVIQGLTHHFKHRGSLCTLHRWVIILFTTETFEWKVCFSRFNIFKNQEYLWHLFDPRAYIRQMCMLYQQSLKPRKSHCFKMAKVTLLNHFNYPQITLCQHPIDRHWLSQGEVSVWFLK